MSFLFDNETPGYLRAESAPVTAYPFTLACWFYADQDSLWGNLININESSGYDDYFSLNARMDRSGDPLETQISIAGANKNARTTNAISLNVWSYGVGIFTSATSRRSVLNGDWANSVESTQDATIPAPVEMQIGQLKDGGSTRNFSGRIAEVAIWNVALIQVEVEQLSRGISPLRIRPENLVAYWPIFGIGSPEPDYIGTANMAITGSPSVADHPPVMSPFGFDLGWQGAFGAAAPAAYLPYQPHYQRSPILAQ